MKPTKNITEDQLMEIYKRYEINEMDSFIQRMILTFIGMGILMEMNFVLSIISLVFIIVSLWISKMVKERLK